MKINILTYAPDEEIKVVRAQHDLGVEIQAFCMPQNLDVPESKIKEIKEKVKGVSYRGFHAPFYGLHPGSIDSLIYKATEQRLAQAWDIARQFSAKHFVTHSGFNMFFKPDEARTERFGRFWDYFLADRDDNIKVHVENVFETRWEYHKAFLDRIEDERVSACLDLGHVNANSDQDHETWIKGLKGKIRYAHIHNNYGDTDSHYGLHRGTIDIEAVLNLLREYAPDAVWTIETTELEESINWLTQKKFI